MEGKIMKILENEMRGKTVMSEEGLYLGVLRNTTNRNERRGVIFGCFKEHNRRRKNW